jgi:hypothetical protein
VVKNGSNARPLDLGAHAAPAVGDGHHRAIVLAAHVQGQPPAFRHGVQRVLEDVQHRLADLTGHGEDQRRRLGLEVDLVADAAAGGLVVPLRPREGQELLEHVAQLHPFGAAHARGPRVVLQPAHGLHAVGGALVDHAQRVHQLLTIDGLVGGQPLQQHLGPAEHRCEPVVDVVGDAGGQRAERAELLLADEAEAQLVLAADVAEDTDALHLAVAGGRRREAHQHGPRIAGARDQQHLTLPGSAAHLGGEGVDVL